MLSLTLICHCVIHSWRPPPHQPPNLHLVPGFCLYPQGWFESVHPDTLSDHSQWVYIVPRYHCPLLCDLVAWLHFATVVSLCCHCAILWKLLYYYSYSIASVWFPSSSKRQPAVQAASVLRCLLSVHLLGPMYRQDRLYGHSHTRNSVTYGHLRRATIS